MSDREAMLLAIKLALKGSGFVSPNPRVGAVIMKDGKVIGKGFHKEFGKEHAEINAIKDACLDSFEGCTLYVTLEPCSHEGKTPACAPVIVEKKFKRVVIGMTDPNPEVNGNGIKYLEDAGIEVETGVLEKDCMWLNRFFIKYITTKQPYVIAKTAQTLDGNITTTAGQSKWITCSESRRRGHAIRAQVDAVIVGKKTVEIDNPSLNVRHLQGKDPKRVVLDSTLSLPLELNVYSDNNRFETIVCCGKNANPRKKEILKIAGVTVIQVKDDDGKLDVADVLNALSEQQNISSVLVEGGADLLSSFAKKNLIDELQIFMAPKLFGSGLQPFKGFKTTKVDSALEFEVHSIGKSGIDIHTILTRK